MPRRQSLPASVSPSCASADNVRQCSAIQYSSPLPALKAQSADRQVLVHSSGSRLHITNSLSSDSMFSMCLPLVPPLSDCSEPIVFAVAGQCRPRIAHRNDGSPTWLCSFVFQGCQARTPGHATNLIITVPYVVSQVRYPNPWAKCCEAFACTVSYLSCETVPSQPRIRVVNPSHPPFEVSSVTAGRRRARFD